jgi:Xaa-Pro aminopeptidase
MEDFSPETFRRRRDAILAGLDGCAMVLPAAPVRISSRDTEYRYRPDSELFYVTGVAEPDAVAVLRGQEDDGPRFVLFVRSRDPAEEMWVGPRPGPEEAGELYGADVTHSAKEMEERLPELLWGARRVHFRLGGSPRVERLVRQALEQARARGQRRGVGPRGVLDPGEVLDPLRRIKDQEEIRRLQRAADITAEAHREAMARVRPGMGEWEIEALVDGTFRRLGADGPGFDTIVAAGSNGCFLHYTDNARTIAPGELVLVDAGAALGLYTADVTRTFPAGGRFSPEQRAVYEVVEAAREAAVARVAPGSDLAAVHDAAVAVLAEGLVALGALDGSVESLVSEEAHKAFFPHHTSHWLGLDVHDVGDYAQGDQPVPLAPGMVLTVEPGLYFPTDLEGPAARFAGVAVRIEDDVLVTGSGGRILGSGVPSHPDDVEALAGSRAS